MDFEKTVAYFRDKVFWQLYVDGIEWIGPQLNERSERFFKAKLIEKSLCSFCENPNDMVHVDQEGRDLYVASLFDFTEVKFEKHSMYTPKGKRKGLIGKNLTLLNSKGTNKHKKLPDHYANSLLILDSSAAAIVRKPTPEKLLFEGDSIKFAGVGWDEAELLFQFNDYKPSILYKDLAEDQQNLIKKSIDEIVVNFVKLVKSESKWKDK